MKHENDITDSTRRVAPVGIVFAVVGVLLFLYFVRRAGFSETLELVRNLGAGFLLVLIISAVRPVVRAAAWTLCFEAGERLRFRYALAAYLIGDACGNLVPIGLVLTEPIKVALVRERVSAAAGFAAIAIENLFYSLSVVLFIFAGAAALLLSFELSSGLYYASVLSLASVAVVLVAAYFVLRRRVRFGEAALRLAARVGLGRAGYEERARRVRAIEDRVYDFQARHQGRIAPLMLLEAGYHFAGVLEVYATLLLITDQSPGLLAAFVLESVNRVVNVVFKFIPMRIGIDEAGSGLLAGVLGLTTAAGVALAIIRKARVLCWTAVGVVLLLRRGLTLRAATRAGAEAKEVAGGQ